MKEINLKFELLEHNKVVLTNQNGDTYTSMSEELMDFLHSIKTTISPIPHQDGASADDVKAYALSIYKEPLNKRGEQRTQSSGQSTTPFGFTKWFSAFYKGYQFAKSEVQKSVAEKDREIAELKKYYVELDGFSHATIGRLTQALTDLSTSNAHRTRLIEAIRKWIKSWRKDQQEIRRIKSELSKANERVKELEDAAIINEVFKTK